MEWRGRVGGKGHLTGGKRAAKRKDGVNKRWGSLFDGQQRQVNVKSFKQNDVWPWSGFE